MTVCVEVATFLRCRPRRSRWRRSAVIEPRQKRWRLGDLRLATWVAIRKAEIADPCILGKPFVFYAAQSTECAAEKHRRGMEGRAVNLDTGGNGSPCLGTTDHDDTHVTLLLSRGRASGTG